MKIRKIVSLTALTTFILLVVTSVILYIVPHGRIAYWSDWRLWGITKTEWSNIHINLGLLLLLAISLHIYYNWKLIVSYLKDRAKQLRIFTREFNVALAFSFLFAAGTYFELPPFYWAIELSDSIKETAAEKYGEPPYGHAELSTLKTFASKMGFDLALSMERLKKAGVRFKSEKQTLQEIAKLNKMTPQQLYITMRPEKRAGDANKGLPGNPPPGLGNRSLADICQEYNLNIPDILRGLGNSNLKASSEMTLKEIGKQNDISPHEVYVIIEETAKRGQ